MLGSWVVAVWVAAWLGWLVMAALLQVVVAATGLMVAVLVAAWSE